MVRHNSSMRSILRRHRAMDRGTADLTTTVETGPAQPPTGAVAAAEPPVRSVIPFFVDRVAFTELKLAMLAEFKGQLPTEVVDLLAMSGPEQLGTEGRFAAVGSAIRCSVVQGLRTEVD